MDSALAKDLKTSRGLKYHYYFAHPEGANPTILLLHGWPSSSTMWHKQASFFRKHGYGILVPDLLGYGGTDKPLDAKQYRFKLMVADIIDILDREKVNKVIVVGHDWGCALTSRLANYHQRDERFLAFGFLAVSYSPPSADFDVEKDKAMMLATYGYERFGYWYFFAEEDASKVIEDHIDSLFNIAFIKDTSEWKTHWGPKDALKNWLLADRKAEMADWTKDEKEYKLQTDHVIENGLAGAFNWYTIQIKGTIAKDEAEIPKEDLTINKPVFFGACLKDYICVVDIGKKVHEEFCPNTTIAEFDAGHWITSELPDEVNEKLLGWVKTIET